MKNGESPAGDRPFMVGDWRVDPGSGRISNASGEVKLEPKVMAVLVCMAQEQGRVVSREHLEETVWTGMIVGYDSLASTIIKLRKAFGDDSRHPHIVETVPKKGYRLIAPVMLLNNENEAGGSEATVPGRTESVVSGSRAARSPMPGSNRVWLSLGMFASIALLAAVLWLLQTGADVDRPEPVTERLSIAVLPFRNISSDAGQAYFSDGITADLITDLSKISGLAVIARNSVFAYKNSDVDTREIGRQLGVRYLLEGSIRKAGDTVRISARLIDANSGYSLWADRFDSSLSDVFAIQDQVTASIVASLEVHLTEKEREQLARSYTSSIEAYDNFLRGWEHFWDFSAEGNSLAKSFYIRAIDLDPQFARAYANIAITYSYEYMNGWSDDPGKSLALARQYARQGVELDPELPQVYWALGLTQMFDRDYTAALESAEKTIALNTSYADGYGLVATILNYAGRPEDALKLMQKAMRLNPRHPFAYKVNRGEIFFNLRDYKNAVNDFKTALERNPEAYEARLWLAAAYGHLGQLDEARWQIEHIRISGGEVSLDQVEQTIPLHDPAQRQRLIDGLIKAGVS